MLSKSLLSGVPIIESPFFKEIANSNYFFATESEIASDLNQYGFAVLPGFFPNIEQQTKQIQTDLIPLFEDCKMNGDKISSGVLSSRIQDGFRYSETVKELACDERIISLLSKLYGRNAFAFQTLNFEYGSQQAAHSDAVHFHSVPERFMCGVWIALEDVSIDAGPLLYYPGSHKLPLYDPRQVGFIPSETIEQTAFEPLWNKLIEVNSFRKKIFTAKAGDALIWTANLLHGGEPITRSNATRWSQVTHYFFEGCDYYTPMHSDMFEGKILKRDPIDIASGLKLSENKRIEPTRGVHKLKQHISKIINRSLGKIGTLKKSNNKSNWSEIPLPADFSTSDYLSLNPDLKNADLDLDLHYKRHGHLEQRPYKIEVPINFDPVVYFELNPDVASSGLSAEVHFTLHGKKEKRPTHH